MTAIRDQFANVREAKASERVQFRDGEIYVVQEDGSIKRERVKLSKEARRKLGRQDAIIDPRRAER